MALWHWILGGIGVWYLLKPAAAPVTGGVVSATPSGRVMSADENNMFVAISNALGSQPCATLTDVTISEGYTSAKFTMEGNVDVVARPTSMDIAGEAKAFATSICTDMS
jgi:hypothetical protein